MLCMYLRELHELPDIAQGDCVLLVWPLCLKKQILEHFKYHQKPLCRQMNRVC